MTHVFISYVRENASDVDRLAERLRSNGMNVWLDRDSIEPGRRWRDVIREAIANGSYFVACFSKEYNQRGKTYMNEELVLAISELRQRPPTQSWFIPVLLNDTDIPDHEIGAAQTLRDIQALPLYRDWDAGVASLLSVLREREASTIAPSKTSKVGPERHLTRREARKVTLQITDRRRKAPTRT